MSQYDFTTVLNRSGGESIKWNMMKKKRAEISPGIVPLSVADMEFPLAPELRDGLCEYLQTAVLGYETAGPGFYEAVTSWTKRRYAWETKPEWLLTTPGVVNALYYAVDSFSKRGEGVIVMTPVYYPFYAAIEKNERVLVKCPLLENEGYYTIDFELFERLAAEKENTVLLFCNPHNPVGRVWTREELERLGEICLRHGIFILSDEIHCDIIMPGHHFTSFASVSKELEHQMMTCIAPSKTFNLAGLMTSIVILEDRQRMKALKASMARTGQDGRVNAIGYKACEIAYTRCDDWLDEALRVIYENHRTVCRFIEQQELNIRPTRLEGTYLQWLDLRAYGFSREEQERLMVEEGELFLDEGYLFGPEGEGFERINLACPTVVLNEALLRMERVLLL